MQWDSRRRSPKKIHIQILSLAASMSSLNATSIFSFVFFFQIKLCDVEDVELLDRRGYLVISVTLSSRGEGKIYLRKTEGIRDWFNSLKVSKLY